MGQEGKTIIQSFYAGWIDRWYQQEGRLCIASWQECQSRDFLQGGIDAIALWENVSLIKGYLDWGGIAAILICRDALLSREWRFGQGKKAETVFWKEVEYTVQFVNYGAKFWRHSGRIWEIGKKREG